MALDRDRHALVVDLSLDIAIDVSRKFWQ